MQFTLQPPYSFLSRFNPVMYLSARRKNRHKKDRKVFICNKEITVYIYDFSSSLGSEAAINFHIKKELDLEKYAFPWFKSFWSNFLFHFVL